MEWLAGQPWCTGKAGMAGNSWPAVCQWFTAAERGRPTWRRSLPGRASATSTAMASALKASPTRASWRASARNCPP
ncbi:CocE/NonD family hydrolase [Streptomyces sp. NPDC004041]|uniref:CocE/NonD family hydrolase n=1 Tax=Streptomyces sp. NPDC004041 TaxID=3364688 RepID=UPI0036854EDE